MAIGDVTPVTEGGCSDIYRLDVGLYGEPCYGAVYLLDAARPAVVDAGTFLSPTSDPGRPRGDRRARTPPDRLGPHHRAERERHGDGAVIERVVESSDLRRIMGDPAGRMPAEFFVRCVPGRRSGQPST